MPDEPMDLISIISLTPDFSRVFRATHVRQPFQRFSSNSIEAVETAHSSFGLGHSWLKPGVNETAIFLASHSL
jgi:hypothetical protein